MKIAKKSNIRVLSFLSKFQFQEKLQYSERAILPAQFFETFLIKNPQTRNSQHEIMHPLYLFSNRIIPFDYDYFFWASTILIGFQKQLQIQDILQVMKLSKEYSITHQGFWNHFENEILLRILKGPGRTLEKKYQQEDQKLKLLFSTLQKASKDNFEILTKQYLQQELQHQQNESDPQQTSKQNPQQNKLNKHSQIKFIKKTKKDIKIQHLKDIAELLIWKNSKNSKLIGQLLEISMMDFQNANVEQITLAIKLMNHQCMTFMEIYNQNKQEYTSRSIKRIYKMQSLYYEEIVPCLVQKLPICEPHQIVLLLENIAVFPIKKRKFKSKIIQQVKKTFQKLSEHEKSSAIKLLVSICGKDHKLLNKYQLLPDNEQNKTVIPEISSISSNIV